MIPNDKSKAPIAGPTINPIPKIAPKSQKLLVRSFWSTAISLKID
ncbi:MAG: hypothetical protein WCI00_02305 [bacterium]